MKIGLALGSGGPRGLAHVGVLKALLSGGIRPDIIAGTSIGALIGGAYATLGNVEDVEHLAYSADMKAVLSALFDPALRTGLIKGQKATQLLREKIGDPDIASLSPRFFAVATDISTGEPVVFDHGSLVEAIRASVSIPLMFQPVNVGGKLLADGGLTQVVPARIAREHGADIVIAVNLNARLPEPMSPDQRWPGVLRRMAGQSIAILQYNLARENCTAADVVIAPDVYGIGWDSFWKPAQVIEGGERATLAMLPLILELLHW
ncbi:MAG: patatin-like phospholipase family protein [Patescibacteria group bacterium]